MSRIRTPFVALACLAWTLAGALSNAQSSVSVYAAAAATQAADAHVLVLDVAADCRTFFVGLSQPGMNFVPGRGQTNMATGKILPGGTLPGGTADHNPVLPVNGVAPIGDWHHRGQTALPLPSNIASAYGSTPPALATFYFLFEDGQALVTENWEYPNRWITVTAPLRSGTARPARGSAVRGWSRARPRQTQRDSFDTF